MHDSLHVFHATEIALQHPTDLREPSRFGIRLNPRHWLRVCGERAQILYVRCIQSAISCGRRPD